MQVSANALEIIKEFEGFRLRAYLDPADIPTIGYGTIRYPDNRRVQMGDAISESEADAFLKFECEEMAKDITDAVRGIALNQNQFDALVSFCYNLGVGAFRGSTLLAKLKANDFAGAAAEFGRWNKATVDGVRKELRGLTSRRAKERALFESTAATAAPIPDTPSDQEKVTSVKGFKQDDRNLVVALDESAKVVEILELGDSLPDTLVAVLRLYPNLRSFEFARSGEILPEGRHQQFSGLGRPIVPPSAGVPRLDRTLLTLGADDTELEGSNDVREMQTRLKELGYDIDQIDGKFGKQTDRAIREFQAEYFGRAEADGKVGPKTWAKLFGEAAPVRPDAGAPAVGKNFLKLTKTDTRDRSGLVQLILASYKDGQLVDSIQVFSGQGRKQTFRKGPDSASGSMEPLPEGKWSIGGIEWRDGVDNYDGRVWNAGLGPAKIRLEYLDPGRTSRSAIEIHIDWNRARAPGTAGCIGIQNVADYKKLAGWLGETRPKFLFVDWQLGSCPTP